MEHARLVHEEDVWVQGQNCRIDIYRLGAQKFYAMTRFSENDAFISDGFSLAEVLRKQRMAIPLAVSCRPSFRARSVHGPLAPPERVSAPGFM